MLVQLTITPLGVGTHISDAVAEAVTIIDDSGLPYQLTPSGTCIEGSWSEVMPLIQRCHERVRKLSPHVITHIEIEDDEGAQNKLIENVASVQQKVGREGRQRTLSSTAS